MGTLAMLHIVFGLTIAVAVAGCVRPAERRARADDHAGVANAGDVQFIVDGPLAGVRTIEDGTLRLWAQAPVLDIEVIASPGATTEWTITVLNAMANAVLTASMTEGVVIEDLGGPRPTVRTFRVALGDATELRLRLAPLDAEERTPFRFAYMADIQTGIEQVTDLFDVMNRDPSIRFVVIGGDLTESGTRSELVRVQQQLETLDVPVFATLGNHELWGDDLVWQQLIGPRNLQLTFHGARVSLVDSASATLDPIVYDRLQTWLDDASDDVHVVATHYPPFDPIGIRQGGFRSRKEAAKLMSLLSEHGVDAVFAGHIHSYYAYQVADVPVYISGGGGAAPEERLDGVDRHYLTVDVTPDRGIDQVGLVRISTRD